MLYKYKSNINCGQFYIIYYSINIGIIDNLSIISNINIDILKYNIMAY